MPSTKVVDRLLASPHYGERWGRHWLDVARFAESDGYDRDVRSAERLALSRLRHQGVQRATSLTTASSREQIAGDCCRSTPSNAADNLIATGFLAARRPQHADQQKQADHRNGRARRHSSTRSARAFLGLTVGCARCHDHKFDPIPTRDYYALAGILRSTHAVNHSNVSQWLERPLPMSAAQEKLIKNHDDAVASLKEKLRLAREAEKASGQTPRGAVAVKDLPGIVIDDVDAKKVGSWKHSVYSGNFVGKGYLYDDREKNEEKTLTFVPTFKSDGVYEVRFAYVPHANRASKVPVRIFHADGEVTVRVDQRKTPPIDGRFISLGKFRFEAGDQWFVMVSTDGADGFVVADAVQFLSEKDLAAKHQPEAQAREPANAASSKTAPSQTLEAQLKALEANGPKRLMAMAVEDAAKVEDCHVCIRGNLRNRGPLAPRRLPAGHRHEHDDSGGPERSSSARRPGSPPRQTR